MQKTTQELQAELAKLREERAQAEASRRSVLESLEKAESRRAENPSARGHWDKILEQLESSLDDVKARLASLDGRIAHAERSLKTAEAGPAPADAEPTPEADSAPPADAPEPQAEEGSAFEQLLARLPSDPEKAARRIMELSPEKLGGLNLEEIAILHGQIAVDDSGSPLPDLDLDSSGVEVVKHDKGAMNAEEARARRERQDLLRSALDKIRANRIDELTSAEERIVNVTRILLERRPPANPRDERLRRILGAAVRRIKSRRKQG